MSSSTFAFLDLPTELKCRILNMLDIQSLLKMSLTSKSIKEVIYASDVLILAIEMAKSELLPMINIQSTPMARKFLKAHVDARLNLPIGARPCVIFPAPDGGIRKERLFRGLFACITDTCILHVWDIRRPDPTRPPTKILMIGEPNLLDVVIEPDYNLLILLCYRSGDDSATIKLLDLTSMGTRSHPWAKSHLITHRPLPDDIIDSQHGQQLLTFRGELLALAYCRDDNLESRRGVIWAWRTGNPIYDSMDFSSSSDFHDLLLLPTPNFFLVTVSNFLVNQPSATLGAWIELRSNLITTPDSSLLVAEYHLPEFENPVEHYLGALDFYSSEPPNWRIHNLNNEDIFPFVSNPVTSVHVLHIWYKTRPQAGINVGGSRLYLAISVKAFFLPLAKLAPTGISDTSIFPLHIKWDEWAPWWTMFWHYEDLGVLSGTSSVCGSRICTVTHPDDDAIEVLVIDFNMKFPCSQRDCFRPLAHFYPKTLHPGINISPWAVTVRTWLPFHLLSKTFQVQREGDKQLICTTVLMDEERIVFSTCVDEPLDIFLDPTSWKVVHIVREQTAVGDNCFLPLPDDDDEDMDSIKLNDQICRMCKEKPHTDAHILLECTAHPKVVDLRRTHLAQYDRELHSGRSFEELFKELMARRDATRMSLSSFVRETNHIYERLPQCSEVVEADRENPASIFFVTWR